MFRLSSYSICLSVILGLFVGCGADSGDSDVGTDLVIIWDVGDTARFDVEPVCEAGEVSCDAGWTTSCQDGIWVRITDCGQEAKSCADGQCVTTGQDLIDDGLVEDVGDDTTDTQTPDVVDVVDLAAPDTTDVQEDLADAGDTAGPDSTDTTPDEVQPDADTDADTEVVPDECTEGDCCDNGHWVVEGEACLAGQDGFDCTQDTCGADHLCKHTVVADACLIESVCYAQHDAHPQQACLWCDASISPTEWSFMPLDESCDDGVFCNGMDKCDGSGVCEHDGDPCAANSLCNSTCNEETGDCFTAAIVVCRDSVGVCDSIEYCNGQGNCPGDSPVDDGTQCDDTELCTTSGTCVDGVCTGLVAVSCTASDQCHKAGVCDPATGECSDPPRTNGADCDDGNPATVGDMCTNGVCGGANLCAGVNCTAWDQCHDTGSCDPATGLCSNPNKANGSACNDGNACTQADTCQAGVCTGGTPVTCAALDQCHAAGTCDPASGLCSNPNKANGTPCSDGDACTQMDTCQSGVCASANLVTCTALDQCHDAGTCDPATGFCSNPNKADNTVCSDGNACTQTDTCQAGACTGANPVTCTALDQCHDAGTCNPATGTCSNPNKPNGTACNDGNACTQTDTCQAGACTGANPVICTAMDQCHDTGTCNPATGMCSNPNKADNTACNDGNACTQTDTCQAGACTGASPVTCTALDQCHDSGTCNPATGMCSNPTKADATACNDGNTSTVNDTCTAGVCAGVDLCIGVLCWPLDQCHDQGMCDPYTGMCSNPMVTDGTSCNDGNPMTGNDTCQMGICSGLTAPTVASTFPADGSVTVAGTTVSITFSAAMYDATLTGQTEAGACTGSIQVSLDGFASCVAFASASPSMSAGDTVATMLLAPGLLVNRVYKIRVTTAAMSAEFISLGSQYQTTTGFTTTSPDLCDNSVVISQIFGGAAGSTSDPNADYVVIHNRGSVAVSLEGWSVQYASATGSTWGLRVPLSGSLLAGQFFLVKMSTSATPTSLPAPDAFLASYSGSMSATAGKVALVSSTTALSGTCPTDSTIVDLLGYGATATCKEGQATAPAPSSTTALFRNRQGCGDIGNNGTDFTTGTPNPVNASAPAVPCGCFVMNESGAPLEADFCNVQYPYSLSMTTGTTAVTTYGQIWENGVTSASGADVNIVAQMGWGLPGNNPQYESWNWLNSIYNIPSGDNDEYMNNASLSFSTPGSYRYVYRFSLDQGVTWTVCGNVGAGSNTGLDFTFASEAVLTVN